MKKKILKKLNEKGKERNEYKLCTSIFEAQLNKNESFCKIVMKISGHKYKSIKNNFTVIFRLTCIFYYFQKLVLKHVTQK